MLALIDLDIFRYRFGFGAQFEDCSGFIRLTSKAKVVASIDACIQKIIEKTNSNAYQGYLSGKGNFRLRIDPEYKANRKNMQKPIYYPFITDTLVSLYGAEVVNGIEADDILAVRQTEDPDNTVIATLDKDLNQIPGWKYNFVTDQLWYQTPEQACYDFGIQLLMGDSVDNIPGLPKVGKIKAEKLLKDVPTDQILSVVKGAYKDVYKDSWELHYNISYDLLKLLTTEEQVKEATQQ